MRIVVFLGVSLALAFLTAGIMAAAPLEVGLAGKAQDFGRRPVDVDTPAEADEVAWVLRGPLVETVKLKFDTDLPVGAKIHVQVRDITSPISGSQSTSTSGDFGCGDGGPLPDGTFCSVALGGDPVAADIIGLDVTVIGVIPTVATTTDKIDVVVAWDLNPADFRDVIGVTVTLEGVTPGETFKVHMTLKDEAGDTLQRVTEKVVMPDGSTVDVTWDLTTEGDPVGPVSAEAIALFQIQVIPGK